MMTDFNSDWNNHAAKAFNEGSDARLAGWPPEDNPYPIHTVEREAWRLGWQDVDKHWGMAAKQPVKRLPPVQKHHRNGAIYVVEE